MPLSIQDSDIDAEYKILQKRAALARDKARREQVKEKHFKKRISYHGYENIEGRDTTLIPTRRPANL